VTDETHCIGDILVDIDSAPLVGAGGDLADIIGAGAEAW
jgi:hypothetical protein